MRDSALRLSEVMLPANRRLSVEVRKGDLQRIRRLLTFTILATTSAAAPAALEELAAVQIRPAAHTGHISVLVPIVELHPVHGAFFISTQGREVDEVVGAQQHVKAAFVAGVGVVDVSLLILYEHA